MTRGRCRIVVKLTGESFKVCQMPCVAGRVPGWGRRDLSVGHGALLHGGLQQHAADQRGHRHRPPCAEEAQSSGGKLAAGRGYLYSSGSGVGGYWGPVRASAVAGTRFMSLKVQLHLAVKVLMILGQGWAVTGDLAVPVQ